jgi:RNA polymerase sigma-70 factor (ECF subfamily)
VDRIYRYIYLRVGQIEVAEDLTATVFLRMIAALPHFTPQPNAGFAAWLYRIASNAVIDHDRKQGGASFTNVESAVLTIADPAPDPLRLVEHQEDVAALRQALQHLTPLQAQVITLRFGSNLPSATVAEILGRSVGAVKALQHAALRRLAQELAD